MTNPRRIQQNSLVHLQLQALVATGSSDLDTLSPVPPLSATQYRPLDTAKKVSREQGKRILREVPRNSSALLHEDIEQVLHNFRLDPHHDVARTTETPSEISTKSVTEATAEQPISEPVSSSFDRPKQTSQNRKERRLSLKVSQPSTSSLAHTYSYTSHPPCTHLTDPSASTMSRPISLLIASLGNPPPYHSTRHSAAHIILHHLRVSTNLPTPTQKSKSYGGGHISLGADVGRPELTLYQSAVQMNVSGSPLLKAWRHFIGLQDIAGRTPGLVVLHDEMEIEPGRLKVRRGSSSAKGHNGIKSVQASLQGAGMLDKLGDGFVKIGVGIGRPSGGTRQSADVSAYVLGQLTSREKDRLEEAAGELVGILYQEMARIGQS